MSKALGLLSGGLDSILAIKVLEEQGINVTGITFVTPFFGPKKAEKAAKTLGIRLIIKNITEEHLVMLKNPRYGYGSGMNPCIDCHGLMLKIAGEIMEREGFDFIFTGEVLGERPMSQNKQSLGIVGKLSGYREYILRPLSARLLEETKPEKEGRVDRSRLLDLNGRQRTRQFEMAEKYGIKDYPNPASGCLLTDPGFSKRLRDLFENEGDVPTGEIELLKAGRHVRMKEGPKIIIGRNEGDNMSLAGIEQSKYYLFAPMGVKGPYCMIPKNMNAELLDKAALLCVSYCSAQEGEEVTIREKGKSQGKSVKTIFSKSNRPTEFV
ncbi:MAG: tRNA 4-thiouridine(8) synthase ThiI [Candidatus Omnitrophica bacterium]|nr:tRNA 4-thiouridine(8) synthase ThiI [Candidatus Omnitrophota bacterium]